MTNQPDLFDLARERAARDAGTESAVNHAGPHWMDEATRVLRAMDAAELTGEDLRLACLAEDITPPHHNAWGGLILRLINSGELIATGRERQMSSPGSHGRRTRVYTHCRQSSQ